MKRATVTIDRRVAVNLNYTVSSDVMNICIGQCGIRHVLTSRRVMEKLDLLIHVHVMIAVKINIKLIVGRLLR